jgi:hypothetical protein
MHFLHVQLLTHLCSCAAILTKLRLYKAPVRSNLQDSDRAKAVADSVENAGGLAAIADNSSNTTATSAAGNVQQMPYFFM